jgi:hypothetical protein
LSAIAQAPTALAYCCPKLVFTGTIHPAVARKKRYLLPGSFFIVGKLLRLAQKLYAFIIELYSF